MNLDRVLERIDELFEENGYALDSTQAECIRAALREEEKKA